MKSALKRVASLLMALIMILEVVTPGVVQARSNNDNRASVSEEEFVPGDAYVPSAQNQPRRQAPSSYRPQRQAPNTYQPSRPAQSAPGRAETSEDVFDPAANKAEVSGEKAPKPLIEDEGESKEMALEFSEEKERVRVASPMNPGGLEDKKFTILTRFDVFTNDGKDPVRKGQTFTLHLDDKLTVKDPSTLKRLSHNGKVITDPPVYNKTANTIKYTVKDDITEDIQVPMAVDVDYNTANIDPNAKKFTIINKVTGIGVNKPPKDLLPVVVDSNGNMLSSIIEPGRDDVIQVIQEGDDYKVNVDAYGEPVVNNREMDGIRWTVRITSDTNLKDLGLKTNFTTVKGSGLGEIQNLSVTNTSVPGAEFSDNAQAQGNLGIVSSKHHNLNTDTKELYYTFYTPRTTKQGSYMLDLSTVLLNKKVNGTTKPVTGAVRLVLPEGYSQDQIREATPTRVGMNNRSTVMGEFTSDSTATWTVTDAVSSKDPGKLPLKDRKLEGKQTLQADGGHMAVYGIDDKTGKMVVKKQPESIPGFPAKDPNSTAQDVGTIAVYELNTKLTNPDKAEDYAVSGVAISKYQDLYVRQEWSLPDGVKMPAQTFTVEGDPKSEWSVEEDTSGKTSRNITLAGAKYWDIDSNGKATKIDQKIKQGLPDSTNYKYYENTNYYKEDEKVYLMKNSAVEIHDKKAASFTVRIVDRKDPNKPLSGATISLVGTGVEAVTDAEGKVTFSNIKPGTYNLSEVKAPAGYKIDQEKKIVTVSDNGDVTVAGTNASLSKAGNATDLVEHEQAPNYPDYMNAMHYGKVDESGNLNFYIYLKPRAQEQGGSTDRNTHLNIRIPGVENKDLKVAVFDVGPEKRASIRTKMESQTIEPVTDLGNNVINIKSPDTEKIAGGIIKEDSFTHQDGYSIQFPKSRFANDWGFLVKVTAPIASDKKSVALSYDWLTDEGTENQANLRQIVTVDKEPNSETLPTITVANDAFEKQAISVTKVDNQEAHNRLKNASFTLKDKAGKTITDKVTDANGLASFGEYAPGKYVIEESEAPEGYIASPVVFDVTVADDGQVTYTPRFKSGSGTPSPDLDYILENNELEEGPASTKITSIKQQTTLQENEQGRFGTIPKVWEAYQLESYKYTATVMMTGVKEGSRLKIQFDPNLDFKKYVYEMPPIKDIEHPDKIIAEPYFDYDNNLLTYVFNKHVTGDVTANIEIKGIVPDIYYAPKDGIYDFTNKVITNPNDKLTPDSKPVEKFSVTADYGNYDTGSGKPAQSLYMRDTFKSADGKDEYVTILSYYNALGQRSAPRNTLNWDWISANRQPGAGITRYQADGDPAYQLNDVKVYRVAPKLTRNGDKPLNDRMPLSFGVRPDQDPNYSLVYAKKIDPTTSVSDQYGEFRLNYDSSKVKNIGTVGGNPPLTLGMPPIKQSEGYVIEQTFKITDPSRWYDKWRIFYMNDGNLESAFMNKGNYNQASGDHADKEVPKFYTQTVKLVNKKYVPGKFNIYKYDEATQNALAGATFGLTDAKGHTIYRTSGQDGKLFFDAIAPGSYTLEESKAPEGFTKSDKTWQVTVDIKGEVTIAELGLSGSTQPIVEENPTLSVADRPAGTDFRVYKKNGNGKPLQGAVFKLWKRTDAGDVLHKTVTSTEKGLVEFGNLPVGTYVLEEETPPTGYKPLDQKWLVVVTSDKAKVYNYVKGTTTSVISGNLVAGQETKWVDVANRDLTGWNIYDNRGTGYVDNYPVPYKMGTRIIAINKKDKYVIQRYVINPEGVSRPQSTAEIHREKPEDDNMNWYQGQEAVKAYQLDRPVTENVEDIRLNNYGITDITSTLKPSKVKHSGQPDRMGITLPETTKPIVVDVKVPYTDENGGVGTGMDYTVTENGTKKTYWKSDYYEKVSIIRVSDSVEDSAQTKNKGAYVSEGSLDVTNDLKKYSFKLKKVKQGEETKVIEGATFTLKGPGENGHVRKLVTDKNGIIQFDDLVEGTYTLNETSPAAGYEQVTTTWTVTVTVEGEIYIKDATSTGPADNNTVFVEGTASPAGQMSRSATLNNFLAPFGEEAAPVSAEAPAAEEAAEAKQTYSVTVDTAAMKNGTVEVKPSAAAGDTVTLTAKPKEGFKLGEVKVTDSDNNEVSTTVVDETTRTFAKPASNVTVTAQFDYLGKPVGNGQSAVIKNKQIGLDLKVFKKTQEDKLPLPGAEFNLIKTDATYEKNSADQTFGTATATSDDKGKLTFMKDGKTILLQKGYYLMTETKPPSGYKKAPAPWKIFVTEENGRMIAKYDGPEDTPSTFLISNHAKLTDQDKTVDAGNGIKYASRVTSINPESKTFVQRIYIDTRSYNGKVNVQINPVKKREEKDTPGKPPETIKGREGVKTAYRTTYRIFNADNLDLEQVLTNYDLSKPDVSMINTARWRPFDWGFDEDQLNLEKGVYFIDVEGYYDDNIVKDGKIDLNIDFYTERNFMQATGRENGRITFKKGGSYQQGNVALKSIYGDPEDPKTKIGNDKSTPEQKYANGLSKEYTYKGVYYKSGYVEDGTKLGGATTEINIKSLYAGGTKTVPDDGLTIENEEESYNITFSKHGRKDPKSDVTGDAVTNNRLEGAVFKLQEQYGSQFVDIEGSYVASAFNGYFGFRGLKPGRYRLMEVQAPKGYKPIKGPVLLFTIAYTKEKLHIPSEGNVSEETIIPEKTGYITIEYKNNGNSIYQYVNDKQEIVKPDGSENAKLIDFVTSGTAKNMGKIVNEIPGKGKVTITKKDEKGNLLGDLEAGAQFKLTRLSAKKAGEGEKQDGVYYGIVGKDGQIGKLVFDKLIIGNYRLEEVDPHPGHINTGQVWNFTVGGKGLDPYAEDKSPKRGDISKNIELLDSQMTVLRPNPLDTTKEKGDTEIQPNLGQVLSFTNKFKVKAGAEIQPGDYFVLKLSKNIDLEGIVRGRNQGLDIFADGVGTIAKATYNRDKGEITYVFTEYARTYKLNEFTSTLSSYIRSDVVKESSEKEKVGFSLGNDTSKQKTIAVKYEWDISEVEDYTGNYNMASKITEYDYVTGDFVHYYYINPLKKYAGVCKFIYEPKKDVENLNVKVYSLLDNSDVTKDMPASFYVDESSNNLMKIIDKQEPVVYFRGGIYPSQSYIIKVTGRMTDKKKDYYRADAMLVNYYSNGQPRFGATRFDEVYLQENKAEAEANLTIDAVNPKNKIAFRKMDISGTGLEGAQFSLERYDDVKNEWGSSNKNPRTSDDNGLFTFDALLPGKYRLRETKKPKGDYVLNPDTILEFNVDDKGKITRTITNADGKNETIEESGIVPIPIVNHKPIKLEKKDANDKTFLAGAEFDVYYKEKEDDEYKPYKIKDPKDPDGEKITYHVKVGDTDPNKGKVSLNLYKSGYYALEETKAPKDYMKPGGFVKEFRLEDDRFSVKEKGFEDNVKKQDGATDKDTSFVRAEKMNGEFYVYYVVNPSHKKRTYDKDSKAQLQFKGLDVKSFETIVINKRGIVSNIGNTPYISYSDPDHYPTLDLYSLCGGGKLVDWKPVLSDSTFILKLRLAPETVGQTKVALDTVFVDNTGKAEASYEFNPSTLPVYDEYWPFYTHHPIGPYSFDPKYNGDEGQALLKKDEARYQRELEDYLDKYRKEFFVKYESEDKPVEVLNYKGTYPFTGGFGPRWIVIIGAVIAAIAAEEYIRRKRSSAEPKGGA